MYTDFVKTELVSAVDFKTIVKGDEQEPPKRWLPIFVFLILLSVLTVILYERDQTNKGHRLVSCHVRFKGERATLNYVTETKGSTRVNFSRPLVTIYSQKEIRKTAHQVQLRGLEKDTRYTFTVELPNGSKTLPLEFSTKSPLKNLRLKTFEGKMRVSWKKDDKGKVACRLQSNEGEWKELQVVTAGIAKSYVEFSKELTPREIELSVHRNGKVSTEAVFSLAIDEILQHTLQDNTVFIKTKKLFAQGPDPTIPWQRGALPRDDKFIELVELIETAQPWMSSLFSAKDFPPERKNALFSSISHCRMLGNWAPQKVRELFWSLESLSEKHCQIDKISYSNYRQQKKEAKPLIEFDNWRFFLPTNFAHKGRRDVHLQRLKKFSPRAKAIVTAKTTVPQAGRLLLHVGNFWLGAMLRLRIGKSVIVLFAKRPAERTRKIDGKRLLASTFWSIDLPRYSVAKKGSPLVIEEFARYEMAQLPALKAVYILAD